MQIGFQLIEIPKYCWSGKHQNILNEFPMLSLKRDLLEERLVWLFDFLGVRVVFIQLPLHGEPPRTFWWVFAPGTIICLSSPSSAVPHPGCGCFGMFRGQRQRNRDAWPYKNYITTSYLNGLLAFRREKNTTFRSCGPESFLTFFQVI